MKLILAGGVGEHGRSCFFVQGEAIRFLVDCGKMADTPLDPNPRLTEAEIRSLDAVFLTHSHADHTGALPWLYKMGFRGMVIASAQTLGQLPFPVRESRVLEEICPGGAGAFGSLTLEWGRAGHCVGSVWYHFREGEKSLFFSGDYTEDTLVYACDPIRGRQADLAVLDCAYGLDETPYGVYCDRLISRTRELLKDAGLVLFPVPKYGRGLELLKLFDRHLGEASYYADDLFRRNLAELTVGGFWYRRAGIDVPVYPYGGQNQGIVFVSDPQLRGQDPRALAGQVLDLGGRGVMTGTLERDGFSESLVRQGKAELLRYPVHLNHPQFEDLKAKNAFRRTVAYHSPELTSEREISI